MKSIAKIKSIIVALMLPMCILVMDGCDLEGTRIEPKKGEINPERGQKRMRTEPKKGEINPERGQKRMRTKPKKRTHIPLKDGLTEEIMEYFEKRASNQHDIDYGYALLCWVRDNPEKINTAHEQYHTSYTTLQMMVIYGHPGAVKALLDAGADPNMVLGPGDEPPLVLAVKCKEESSDRLECVRLLIGAGADVNKQDQYYTPLGWATYFGLKESIELLKAAGGKLKR